MELAPSISSATYNLIVTESGQIKKEFSHLFVILPRDQAKDLDSYVISKNLKRRHLDVTARAQAAEKIAEYRLGDNQHTVGSAKLQTLGKTAADLNVSARQAHSARAVRVKGTPELKAAVDARKLSLAAAEAAAGLDRETQLEVATTAMKGDKKTAAAKIKAKKARKTPRRRDPTPEEMSAHRRGLETMEQESAIGKLKDLSVKYGLGHSDGYECEPVPDHLLLASYEDVTAAYGLLGHIKYAMERDQAAKASEAVETEAPERSAEAEAANKLDCEIKGFLRTFERKFGNWQKRWTRGRSSTQYRGCGMRAITNEAAASQVMKNHHLAIGRPKGAHIER